VKKILFLKHQPLPEPWYVENHIEYIIRYLGNKYQFDLAKGVEGDIVEGATLVTITEADIPDEIKELIDCGAYTMEDAIAKLAVGGSREKRMILRRPVIQMVGVGDEPKKPVILKKEEVYDEDDLILDCMTESEETSETKETKTTKATTKPTTKKAEEPADDLAWMAALEDEE
jgi:hypothetical protein